MSSDRHLAGPGSGRLGFLHVPKCAGTALSDAMHRAFGLKRRHVSALITEGEASKPHALLRGSPEFAQAKGLPFIAGHLTVSDLRALRREVIVTVLREPAARLFSHFAYDVARARTPHIAARDPRVERFASMSFREWVGHRQPNKIARRLLSDFPGTADLGQSVPFEERDALARLPLAARIDRALRRLDLVAAGPMAKVAEHLAPFVPGGRLDVPALNVTRDPGPLEIGCDEREFAGLIERTVWLDRAVCARAARLFPATVDGAALATGFDELLSGLRARYDLRFTPS